ncbi:histidine kinase [Ralstonia sp. A12]|nr:histidine kinase [Ralstonia sp. A12]
MAAGVLLSAAVAGCAVGPDFKRPDAPDVPGYTANTPAPTVATPTEGGQSQRVNQGQAVSAKWWTLFGSDALNTLVEEALKANPDLQSAKAALRAARETLAAQKGGFFPALDAEHGSKRAQEANAIASPLSSNANLYTLHTSQLAVSYTPDVFGGVRRQVESAAAQAEVARFEYEAAYLTLTSNVVNAAITEASLRAQVKATQEAVRVATQLLETTRKQQRAGLQGGADVAAQEAELAQVEATLPPLEKQLAQQRNLITVLAGRYPSEEIAQTFELDTLHLPAALPLSLPSELVEQRPDIRAAQAQLHAASAEIGVAKAARLPSITLTGNIGSSAEGLRSLFTTGTGFWSLTGGLAMPLFRGGSLMHQQRAAEATYDQAAAQYRSVVLAAFQNVSDTLHAIAADARSLQSAHKAEQAARKSLGMAQRQLAAGMVGSPAVLQAQQAYQQALVTVVQARADRLTDSVALLQALGGGWWNRDEQLAGND